VKTAPEVPLVKAAARSIFTDGITDIKKIRLYHSPRDLRISGGGKERIPLLGWKQKHRDRHFFMVKSFRMT